ncbi:MAG: hypothetical protein QM564_10285 [Bergeyella sp.]
MENPIVTYKKELIEWIKNLDDLEVLSDLVEMKEGKFSLSKVSEPQAEYAVKDDFEERFAKGFTSEQARAETKRRINEWWGK